MFGNFFQGGGDNPLIAQLKNLGLNQEQAAQALPVAEQTVTDTVKQEVSAGNVGGILGLLNGGAEQSAQNPLFAALSGNMVQNLISKVGLPAGLASTVSAGFLPQLLAKFQGQAKDESGNVSEAGLLSSFGLGNVGGLVNGLKDKLGNLGGFFG
jgi:hypothetical protein